MTEASRTLVALAATLPHLTHVEIRCDARNAPSAAIPKRLGFVLATTLIEAPAHADEEPVQLQVWTLPLSDR